MSEREFRNECRMRLPHIEVENRYRTYQHKIDDNWSYVVTKFPPEHGDPAFVEIRMRYHPTYQIAWATRTDDSDWTFQ